MKRNVFFITEVLFCVTMVFLTPCTTAHAKEGYYLGLQVPFNKIGGDFDNIKTPAVKAGTGLGLIAGYGFNPDVSLELDLAGTLHRSAGRTISFREFSLNGKYSFDAAPDIKPFLLVGVGSFTLGDDSLRFGGLGYNFGIGMDFFLSSRVSWGVALIGKVIKYDRVVKGSKPASVPGSLNGETSSLRFDVSYHF